MSARRVAGLDGLRGVAVLLVIASHAVGTYLGDASPTARLLLVPANGAIGVTLFFVLSGYLITGILHRERERNGRVHFGNFYIRRTLRIFPAFYTFLAAVVVLAVAGAIDVGWPQALSAGTFTWDYSPAADGWWLGHTWSLAIEEQFYLLWPFGLALLGARRACNLALAVLLVSPLIRVATHLLAPDDAWMMFHARADALLLGCLLALAPAAYPAAWQRVASWACMRWTGVLAVLALLASSALEQAIGGYWVMTLGYSVDALAGGALLLVVVTPSRPSRLTAVLHWRPLAAVGLISYSLYLWQQLFLPPRGTDLPGLGHTALAVPAVFLAATGSYFLVERPFLRLKDRLQRPVSAAPTPARPAADLVPPGTPEPERSR